MRSTNEFRQRMHVAMVMRGMTVKGLAQKIGMTNSKLSGRCTSGKITVDTARDIANTLDVSLDWLLDEKPFSIEGMKRK